mgnify:CR=1 FL=1
MKVQKIKGFRLNKHYFKLYLIETLMLITKDLGGFVTLITLAYDKDFGLFFTNSRNISYGIEFYFYARNTPNERILVYVYQYNGDKRNKITEVKKLFLIK